MEEEAKWRKSVRARADEIKPFRCKNLIAVLENPTDVKNIGTVIRNVNALGVEKAYVVDSRRALPDDWQHLREKSSVSKTSVSAVKWTFVKRFDSTNECFDHLEKKWIQSDRHIAPCERQDQHFPSRRRLHCFRQARCLVRQRSDGCQRSRHRKKRDVRLHPDVRYDRKPQPRNELGNRPV
jgi:hypothetical protein